jgi:hypothetical protein
VFFFIIVDIPWYITHEPIAKVILYYCPGDEYVTVSRDGITHYLSLCDLFPPAVRERKTACTGNGTTFLAP